MLLLGNLPDLLINLWLDPKNNLDHSSYEFAFLFHMSTVIKLITVVNIRVILS